MTATRVVIADDHAAVRAGIRGLLNKAEDIEIVGEAGNGIEAVEVTNHLCPDVLLLDMEMPGMMGIDVAKKLVDGDSKVNILAVSAHEDKQYIVGMLGNGAAGYLTKDEVPETLVKAVRGVAKGERGWVSRRVAAQIAVWAKEDKLRKIGLSKQELDILRMQLNGKSYQEIAHSLGLHIDLIEEIIDRAVVTIRNKLNEGFTPA